MKQQVEKIFSHKFTIPVFVAIYGVLNILYAEKLPANEGLGWDGLRYSSIAAYMLNSPEIDNYILMRIFPPAIVHIIFKVFSIEFSIPNIIKGFEFVNLAGLIISAVFIRKIFDHLKITFEKQMLGFVLLFVSYAIAKFNFYYPVMTDTPALCLSIVLLYFYLTNQTINLLLIVILSGFTWPVVFYQGIILLMFPVVKREFEPLNKVKTIGIQSASALAILVLIIYFIYVDYDYEPVMFTIPIDLKLINISAVGVVTMFFFYPKMLTNRLFFTKDYLLKNINVNRVLTGVAIVVVFNILLRQLNISGKMGALNASMLSSRVICGMAKPLFNVIAHGSYFGSVILLVIIFWNRFSKVVSGFGLGLSLAFMFNFYLFVLGPESRNLINLFPWLVVFLIAAINDYRFSNLFYFTIFLFNLVLSKIWFSVSYNDSGGTINTEGTIGSPNDLFFMNLGPWMSSEMYLKQALVLILFLVILFLLLFKIDLKKGLIPLFGVQKEQ